jgi:hypothetical protein
MPAPKTTALTTKKNTAIAEMGTMSVDTIVDRKKKILEVMHAVMKDGEHYGKVGGGAEADAAEGRRRGPRDRVRARADVQDHAHRSRERSPRVRDRLHADAHPDRRVLGEGVGSCSTMESKYRWRKRLADVPRVRQGRFLLKSKSEARVVLLEQARRRTAAARRSRSTTKEITQQDVGRKENPTSPTPTTRS